MGAGRIAIVGAGASGSALAVQLLDRPGGEVVLIERSGAFGPGLAYSTPCERHLLNVRAARMSLRAEDPDHFVRWLEARGRGDPQSFVPRADYGRYIRDTLADASASSPGRLFTVAGEVTTVSPTDRGVTLAVADGRSLEADQVVLAMGNPPPARLKLPGLDGAGVVHDPWAPGALDDVGPEDEIFLIGTGLTAVDVLLALEDRKWRGRAVAVSRRGLLPRVHGPRSADADAGPAPGLPLSRRLYLGRRASEGAPWQEVMDHMREHGQPLWRQAGPAERSRFLRHLRPWWDVHRHRMAPEIGEQVEALRREGRLAVRAGRLDGVEREGETPVVVWRPRGGGPPERTAARWVVNCTGPDADPARSDQPLLRHLLDSGAARSDPLRLGLDTDADGRVIDREGRPQPRLWAVGPLTRGALWEIVAVPDIRVQARELADRVSAPPPARRRVLTAHLDEVGESYFEHMGVAVRFGLRMLGGGAAALIHGVAPFLFSKTASGTIETLYAEMARRRRGCPPET